MTGLETYVARVDVTGMPTKDLGGLDSALSATSARLRVAGEQVEYRGGWHRAEAHSWLGVFAAADPDVVYRVIRISQVTRADVLRVVRGQTVTCVTPPRHQRGCREEPIPMNRLARQEVTAIVDLMLDWDLPVLELSLGELAGWLEVDPDVARRALVELGALPGVDVLAPVGPNFQVRVDLDIDQCPLTAVRPGMLDLATPAR